MSTQEQRLKQVRVMKDAVEILNNTILSKKEKMANINYLTEQAFNFEVALKLCATIENSGLIKKDSVTFEDLLNAINAEVKASKKAV